MDLFRDKIPVCYAIASQFISYYYPWFTFVFL